jgi:hypothetical protein
MRIRSQATYRVLGSISGILSDLGGDDLLGDTVSRSSFSHQLGVAAVLQHGIQNRGFIHRCAHGQETLREMSDQRPKIKEVNYLPVILENAGHIVLAQCLGNLSPFLLRQSNATVVLIEANTSIEIASIYDQGFVSFC